MNFSIELTNFELLTVGFLFLLLQLVELGQNYGDEKSCINSFPDPLFEFPYLFCISPPQALIPECH